MYWAVICHIGKLQDALVLVYNKDKYMFCVY